MLVIHLSVDGHVSCSLCSFEHIEAPLFETAFQFPAVFSGSEVFLLFLSQPQITPWFAYEYNPCSDVML